MAPRRRPPGPEPPAAGTGVPAPGDERWSAMLVRLGSSVYVITAETAASAEQPCGPLESLTPAERAVAWLVHDGLGNAAIARRRGSSSRTVANQLASIFRKLGVTSRSALVAWLAERASTAPP